MASAASRSAEPAARVSSASTARPLRFSISTWPMKQSRLVWPSPLRNSRASSSLVAVRLVRSLLTMEVALAVAARRGRCARAVLRPEALQARPRLDQRPINREVLVREQPLDAGIVEHGSEELRRDLAVEQPVAVLGEHGHVPHLLIDAETDKPAEQQVIVQLLHQLSLRAHGIERLQQQPPQQLLRRDRRPADRRIDRLEIFVQPRQRRVHDRSDRPQRMAARHTCLQVDITEQAARPNFATAHRYPRLQSWYRITQRDQHPAFFNLLELPQRVTNCGYSGISPSSHRPSRRACTSSNRR